MSSVLAVDLGPAAQDAERSKNGSFSVAHRNGQLVDSVLEFFLRDNEAPRPVPVHQFGDFLRSNGPPPDRPPQ